METATLEIDLVIEAAVDTPGPQAPLPGHGHAISITRYRVLRVIRGEYSHAFVLVGHDRADMNSGEFRPGVRKRLELSRRFPPHTTQLNKFVRDNPGVVTYYCVNARTEAPNT